MPASDPRAGLEQPVSDTPVRVRPSPRPWLCPEPRCTPIQNLRDGDYEDITVPEVGQSFTCWGQMAEPCTFVYDGVDHTNDLNCCHYTPLKGLIRWQENAEDWNVLASYYSMAWKKVTGQRQRFGPDEEVRVRHGLR